MSSDLGSLKEFRPKNLVMYPRFLAAFSTHSRKRTASRNEPRIIAKETSIEIYAKEMNQWFPNCRWVQLVRDPRDNFAALKAGLDQHYLKAGESRNQLMASLINRAGLGMRVGKLNEARFGKDRYHLVRFEDLVADPNFYDGFVDRIPGDRRRRLSLPANDSGSWQQKATTTTEKNFQGFLREMLERWRDRITIDEARVIEHHLQHEMAMYDYQCASSPEEQANAAMRFLQVVQLLLLLQG